MADVFSPSTPHHADMSAFLHTQRLSLCPLEHTDLPLLQGLNADPEVMRSLGAGMPLSHTQTADHELPRLLGLRIPGLGRSCWLAFSHTGAFIGWFALMPTEDADRVALGYRLQREHQGQGYATEGARLLLRLAFEQTPVQECGAETMAVNLASRRVLERLGLRHVRTYHGDWPDPVPGAEQGEAVYRLRRTDWPA